MKIKLSLDQIDDLNRFLNDLASRYTTEAAALKQFSGAFAQEAAEERMSDAAKASALIALLLEQCG